MLDTALRVRLRMGGMYIKLIEILPGLAAGLTYTLGTLALKRAFTGGVGPARSLFFSNIIVAVCFFPVCLWLGPQTQSWGPAAIVVALTFVGQVLGLISIRLGSVSVITSLLGVKPVIVAFFASWIAHEPLRWNVWTGALLTAVAIALLGSSEVQSSRKSLAIAILGTLGCSVGFGVADVLIQIYAPRVGTLPFVAYTSLFMVVPAFLMVPFFRGKLTDVPPELKGSLFWGSALIALQTLILLSFIAITGKATLINILYNTRGLWSLVLVWLIGHYFHNKERDISRRAFTQRLVGACLLFASILLVLIV